MDLGHKLFNQIRKKKFPVCHLFIKPFKKVYSASFNEPEFGINTKRREKTKI